ncbi:MAG TPA: 30S ribosomal protein S16 [Dehalococcoidia bacterium]|nr:30S ribosomal protein S16 [Dehalococcoidia bacterium]
MVRIRLRRQGKKRQPIYRIVVADSRAPRDGDFIETIGLYNPLTDPETVTVDEERLRHWLGHGAQPSETVDKLLRRKGFLPTAAASS